METRYAKKLGVMFEFARSLATLSTCRRNHCGAIVFTPECDRVLAIGYNGPCRGLPNGGCTDVEGHCGCAHAEVNAMVKLAEREPCLMFSTTAPCLTCAQAILNSGQVIGYFFDRLYRDAAGLELLHVAGLSILPSRAIRDDCVPSAESRRVRTLLDCFRAGRAPGGQHKTLLGLERLLKSGE